MHLNWTALHVGHSSSSQLKREASYSSSKDIYIYIYKSPELVQSDYIIFVKKKKKTLEEKDIQNTEHFYQKNK